VLDLAIHIEPVGVALHLEAFLGSRRREPLGNACHKWRSFNIAMENGPFIDGSPIKNGDFPWLCGYAK